MNKKEYLKYKRFCYRYAKVIFGYKHPEYDDAISDAMLAVLNAIKLYDPNNERGASLNTYASRAIRNHMLNYKKTYDNKKVAEDSKLISRDTILDEYNIDLIGFNENKDLHYDENNTIMIINDYINTLKNERLKLIFTRIFQEDKTMQIVADELCLNIETIRIGKVRIITMIRNHLPSLNIY